MSHSILLCDDEIHILRAAEFKLRRAGFDVRTAGNGEDGWQAICDRRPDVLVTDCQMPRLDGLGLVARLRAHPPTRDLPVLMLTAKGFELSHDDLAARLNILRVIAKPFSPRELLQTIEQVLGAGVLVEAS
jgi:CheY-like chemotaxis protein